jgi:hypothetical protein
METKNNNVTKLAKSEGQLLREVFAKRGEENRAWLKRRFRKSRYLRGFTRPRQAA